MFSGKEKTFYKSIHSLSSFSSLFSILKTIFQVQVRKTLEHNRVCPDICTSAVSKNIKKRKYFEFVYWNICMYIV